MQPFVYFRGRVVVNRVFKVYNALRFYRGGPPPTRWEMESIRDHYNGLLEAAKATVIGDHTIPEHYKRYLLTSLHNAMYNNTRFVARMM